MGGFYSLYKKLGAIAVLFNGNLLTSQANSLNFTGDGQTTTNIGSAVTVNIPGGGGAPGIFNENFVTDGGASYTLSQAPTLGSEAIYLNGARQEEGGDYSIVGAVFTFFNPPAAGQVIVVDYSISLAAVPANTSTTIATVAGIDMVAGITKNLYTVPINKKLILTEIISLVTAGTGGNPQVQIQDSMNLRPWTGVVGLTADLNHYDLMSKLTNNPLPIYLSGDIVQLQFSAPSGSMTQTNSFTLSGFLL